MHTLPFDGESSPRGRTARRAAVALALAAVVSLALIVAGCGSDSNNSGVAQAPTASTETQPPQSGESQDGGSTSGDAAAYSACMRSHGIPKFPDPDRDGTLRLKAGPGTGIDPESQQFKAADEACRTLAPPKAAPSPAEQARERERLLEFATCMRSHGLPNFPDPSSSGGVKIGKASGVDPESPQFKQAEKACEELLPGGAAALKESSSQTR